MKARDVVGDDGVIDGGGRQQSNGYRL